MRFIHSIFFLLFFSFSFAQKQNPSIGFIENKGQIIDQKGKQNKDVLYLLNTNGLNVQIKKNGFSYDIYETKKVPLTQKDKSFTDLNTQFTKEKTTPDYSFEYSYHRIDIDFENSNSAVKLIAEEKSSDYDNYYNVAHAPGGITGVHKYKKITYQNIYNHIDVIFFIPKDTTKAVEYNFIVKPGGKVSDIQLKFNGVKTELADNKIRMNVRFGQMEETLPLSWIENGNSRKEISVGYRKIKNDVYGFEGDVNASNGTIVIDPVPIRLWGTFFGGEKEEYVLSMEKDSQDNVYICGSTTSKDFIATSGVHQDSFGSIEYYSPYLYITDGFVAKFDQNGNRLWGTFYGGKLDDTIKDISISNNDIIGFCGNTNSNTNISTMGSFKDFKSGSYEEMFFGTLNSNGTRIWASYFGDDSGRSWLNSIAFDTNNNIYIAGTSSATNYIATPGAHKSTPPASVYDFDGFISKFTLTGTQIWGTYYGGDHEDFIDDLITDTNGDIIAVGNTNSTNGIVSQNSYQQILNNTNSEVFGDGFAVCMSSVGIRNWGTYFGSASNDRIFRVKKFNNALYFVGETVGDGMGTPNAFEISNQNLNIISFISKFDYQNQSIIWYSYSSHKITDLDINQNEEIYIVGEANSLGSNIATPNALTPFNSGFVSYIRKLNNNCQILWGTYMGTTGFVLTPFVKLLNDNTFYVSGTCWANNLAITYGLTTLGSYQRFSKGNHEAYINKLKDCESTSTISSNSPICIGKDLRLNASGGNNYSWTGPNSFTSTDQNPIITNANAIHSGEYSCTITGTGECDNTLKINVIVGDNTSPVPNIANLQTIIGDCNTLVSTIPTATDNCAGLLNGTTSDPLTYTIPGNYTIHWNYNDGNGNTSTQNQSVVISTTDLPTSSSPQDFCIQENADLNDILITGQNLQWYDAQTGGNLLSTNTVLQNGVTYYASQTINNCESTRIPVTIIIYSTPPPTGNSTQSFCSTQNATLNNIAITGTDVKWYSTLTNTQPLSINTPLVNNTTYYATQTLNGCESVNRLQVTITLINTLNANDFSEYFCDDLNNGHKKINLSDYNTSLLSNTNGNTFSYYKTRLGAQNQTSNEKINNYQDYNLTVGVIKIFVRIDNTNSCHQIVELSLTLYSRPIIPIQEVIPICEGSSITINAGNFDHYSWSTNEGSPSITIDQPGDYSVTVTENHIGINCSSTKNFKVVKSNKATIQSIITSDWTNNNNTITILVTSGSLGDYEYSIDGTNYQSSNTFTNLPNGEYTAYIRDKNGCGITQKEVFLLMYPKFFTPNGDGSNDYWKINFSTIEPNLIVNIYNRYGKLLKQLSNDSNGWEGNYLGQSLPADDYWFTVIRADGKEYKGHFTLKR